MKCPECPVSKEAIQYKREIEKLRGFLIEAKRCPKCCRELSAFYSRDADGVIYECKPCEEYYEQR